MLSVAKGVYLKGTAPNLPIPLIKEVSILSTEQEETQDKRLKVEVKIILQTTNTEAPGPFNVHISALMNENDMVRLKMDSDYIQIRKLIMGQYASSTQIGKNIAMGTKRDNVSSLSYNQKESSQIFYETITVPLELSYIDKIDYLCLVVATSETTSNFSDTRSLAVDFGKRNFAVSAPVFETVLVKGTVPQQTNVFTLRENSADYGKKGEVWTGPAHATPRGLMTGAFHSPQYHPYLKATRIINLKIKDNRVLKLNDFLQESSTSQIRPSSERAVSNPRPTGREKYLSKPTFSRSRDNSVKIFFSFDLHRFMTHMSDLSFLFKNKSALLSASQIIEINVYRQRANASNLSNDLTFDKTIAQNGCSLNNKKLVGVLSENTVSLVQAANNSTSGIYEIMAVDKEMALEQESDFIYTIEIEIVDNSATAVKMILDNLKNKMAEFEEYMLEFSNFNRTNYDVDAYIAATMGSTTGVNSWKGLLIEYMTSLLFLVGNDLPNQMRVLSSLRSLQAFAAPAAASPESLIKFKGLINQFIMQLEAILTKKTITGKSDKKMSFRSKIAASRPLMRRLKYETTVATAYSNQLESSAGFDYLGDGVTNGSNRFNRISQKAFSTRIGKEVQKYNVSNVNVGSINKYGFLSPDVIRIPTGDIRVSRKIDFDHGLDLLRANTAALSRNKNFVGDPRIEKYKKLDTEEVLAREGVSFKRNRAPLKELAAQDTVDSSDYFSKTSPFAQDDLANESTGDTTPRYKSFFSPTDKLTQNPVVQKIVASAAMFSKDVRPTDIPSIQGSIAQHELENTKQQFVEMNPLEKNIHFNSIVRVEYLNSYELGVEDPKWTPLNLGALNRATKANKSLLCRLSHSNKVLNIENRFELSKYDSLFVLGSSNLKSKPNLLTYEGFLISLRKKIQGVMTSALLSPKRAGSNILSQYACSDAMIYDVAPRRPQAKPPARAGGGGY